MSLLPLFSFSATSTLNNGKSMIRNFLSSLVLGASLLTACGVPVSYDPCYNPEGCLTDTNNNGGNSGKPSDGSCDDLTANAVEACGVGNVIVDCTNGMYYCAGSSSSSNGGSDTTVTIYMTVTTNADGSTTITYDDGDPSTPDCADSIDNDGDGKTDYVADGTGDPDCNSATDTSEASSSSGGDTDTDSGGSSSGCVVTAGGIEYCDGVDNDCDGSIDNGDYDGDGYISAGCTRYDGLDPAARPTGDCSDSNGFEGWIHSALIHPGQLEVGDWIDEDCDGNDDASDNNGDGDVTDAGDYSCQTLCDSDGDGYENFERDGDAAFECVDAFFNADQDPSGDSNPLASFSYDYDDGTSTTVAGNSAVSCENSTQSNSASWSTISGIETEMCARTPALTAAECAALF